MKSIIPSAGVCLLLSALTLASGKKSPVRFNPDPNPPATGSGQGKTDSGAGQTDFNQSPSEMGNVVGETTTGNSVAGTVQSIDRGNNLIRIRTERGQVSEYNLTDQTEITRQQEIGKLSDVKPGDSVSLQVEIGSKKVKRLHISPPAK